MMGYMAGGFIISRWGYAWGFLSCGLMLFAALLLVFFFAEDIPIETEFRPQEKERFRFRIPQFSGYVWGILFVLLLTGLARYFEQPYIALRVEEIGGIAEATKWTAIVSAVTALAGVLAGLGLGYLCDRLPPERIVVPAAIGSGILLMLQAATASMWVFGTARFCQYFMAGGIEPVFQTMLSRVTPPEKRGAVFGFAASFRSIGVLFSMAVGGVLIYYFGVRWIFFISGIFFFLLTPLLLRVIHRKSKKNV